MVLENNAILVSVLGFLVFLICTSDKLRCGRVNIPGTTVRNLDIKVIIVFLYLWLFAVLIRDSYDIFFYRSAYDIRVSHGKEILFDLFQFSMHDIGMSFNVFLFFWNTVVTVLLFLGISKYTDEVPAVAAMTILTPFTLYITQMRNSMVSVILLIFIPLLFTGRRKDRIIYTIVVLLCAQIHIIAYAYLFFLLLKRDARRAFPAKYFILITITTVFAMVFSAMSAASLTGIISSLPVPGTISGRLIAYVGGEKTPIKAAVYLLIKHVGFYLLTDWACRLQQNNNPLKEADGKKHGIIRELNTMMLVFLPVAIVNASFERIFNCFIIIQYAEILNVRRQKTGLMNIISIKISMQFMLLLFSFILFAISVHSNPEDLFRLLNSIGS